MHLQFPFRSVQCRCILQIHQWKVSARLLIPAYHDLGKKGHVPITYEESNFKTRYLDEYTGETLAPHLIRPAIEDELNYFNNKVWELSTIDEMKKVPDYILVRSRWVLCNKGDAENPDVRARLVSCELNKGDRND